jgi:hypothetical protein
MSIHRQKGNVIIECDRCETQFTLDSPDYELTWAAAKRDGWEAKKIGKDWVNGCPNCGAD